LKYDAVVVSRTITYNPNFHKLAVDRWHAMPATTRLIVDVDDYWILPENHPNRVFWAQHNTSSCIIETMRLANQVWTTNKNLAKKIGRINTNVKVIANSINPNHAICAQKDDMGIIGVIVNNTHEMNLHLLRNGLKTLAPNKYELRLIGADESRKSVVDTLLDVRATDLKVVHVPWTKPTEYMRSYNDVNHLLCPLAPINFNKFRSRLKLEEAAAYKMNVVCSKFGPYSNVDDYQGVTAVNSFDDLGNNLDNISSDVTSVDTWADQQQKRIDNLHYAVYYS